MNFSETPLPGAYVIELEQLADERGWFARTFDRERFEQLGLDPPGVQCSVSFNERAGTLRGMHFQEAPHAEDKLVRCTRGAIWDVIVDLRPDSPTYGQHFGVELSAENHRALYVPALFAHGYQTLTEGAEVTYQVGEYYAPGYERGLRHDDPALGIRWPLPVSVISPKDATWPLLAEAPLTTGAPADERAAMTVRA